MHKGTYKIWENGNIKQFCNINCFVSEYQYALSVISYGQYNIILPFHKPTIDNIIKNVIERD